MNLRLPGQYYDAETSLHYNYHRHYDPGTGRYQTSDPLGLLAGLNTYGYVAGNPLSYIDPKGLLILSPTLIGGGGLLSIARSVFFVETAGVTGLLARFVAGVVAVGASPVVVGGTVVAIAALAVYYHTDNNANEAAFTQDMGGEKPTAADFDALRAEMERFAGEDQTQYPWEGMSDWSELFWMQSALQTIQQRYILQHEGCDEDDHPLLNEAHEAVAAAQAAADAAEQVDTAPIPGTYTGQGNGPDDDPECSALRDAVTAAKDAVRAVGKCRLGMNMYELTTRKAAWLSEAQARSTYHQRCWGGGNEGHQKREADAWNQVGSCHTLIAQ